MSASVVAAFACAVFAAVGTGVLVGRCIRMPRMDLIAWACALAALAVAFGAQALGAYHGYGSGTFRTVQFSAQLIAPLWLAWGLAELTGKSLTVRFGAKLVTMALTVVTGVVLVTDPLSSTPFSKSWPAASAHYQIIPRSLLSLIAGVTVAAVVIALISVLVRVRTDPAWRRPAIAICAAGVAAVAILGLRLTLPNAGYLAVCAGCAALTLFAGVWAAKTGLAGLHGEQPPDGMDRSDRRAVRAPAGDAADDEVFRGYGRADDSGHRRYGDRSGDEKSLGEREQFGERQFGEREYRERQYGERQYGERQFGDDAWYRPASGSHPARRYPRGGGSQDDRGSAMNGVHQGDRGYEPDDADRTGIWAPRTFGGSSGPLGGSGPLSGNAAPVGSGGTRGGSRLGGSDGFGSAGGPGGGSGLGGTAKFGAEPGLAGRAGLGGASGLGSGTGLGRDRARGRGRGLGGSDGLGTGGNGALGGSDGLGTGGNGALGSGDGLGGTAKFGAEPGLGGGAGLGGASGRGRNRGGRETNGGPAADTAPGANGGLGSDSSGANGGLGSGSRHGNQARLGPRTTAAAAVGTVAAAGAAAAATAPAGPEPAAGAAADQGATQRLYGLIAIYTLAEGAAADFDALAERVVEEVRADEPDALVYAVHSVPNAEMQRIFYEVYRDRMAYEDHQRQPHIQRFEADRAAHVLATNVIELGMQQAKLSPLPGLSQLFGRAQGA
jgi:quinol monooxygenase YgiN